MEKIIQIERIIERDILHQRNVRHGLYKCRRIVHVYHFYRDKFMVRTAVPVGNREIHSMDPHIIIRGAPPDRAGQHIDIEQIGILRKYKAIDRVRIDIHCGDVQYQQFVLIYLPVADWGEFGRRVQDLESASNGGGFPPLLVNCIYLDVIGGTVAQRFALQPNGCVPGRETS